MLLPSRTSYHAALCFSSSVIFLLVDACVGLNWLLVSFLSHVNKNIIHSFIIEDIHTHTGATVRIGNKFSRRFATTSGVRQRCVLAPALFLVAIDWILNHLAPDVGTTVGQRHFTDLTYADDAAIFMCDVTQAASTLQSFNTIAASLGLRISWAKTMSQTLALTIRRLHSLWMGHLSKV